MQEQTKNQKVVELSDAPLDWAVAKAAGHKNVNIQPFFVTLDKVSVLSDWDNATPYSPSVEWAQGGYIVEHERISIEAVEDEEMEGWIAYVDSAGRVFDGATPLVAAMRCFVTRKLGDTVDIPTILGA